MKTDLIDLCFASIEDEIEQLKLEWENKASVCVVLASGGYPCEYKKGLDISGLEDAVEAGAPETYVFHAGTKLQNSELKAKSPEKIYITDGGRVLNVVSLGDNVRQARDKVYKAISKIKFEGMHYRKDIAYRALEKDTRRVSNKNLTIFLNVVKSMWRI